MPCNIPLIIFSCLLRLIQECCLIVRISAIRPGAKKAKTFPIIIILAQDDLCCLKTVQVGFRRKLRHFRTTEKMSISVDVGISPSRNFCFGFGFGSHRFFSKPAALKREAKENNLGWVALGWAGLGAGQRWARHRWAGAKDVS